MSTPKVLEGIRVIDFTWFGPGPAGTAVLAYLGAEVIKVESWGRQMPFPGIKPRPSGAQVDPVFWDANLNKRAIRLNLVHPKSKSIIHKLVSISHVVAESWRPGVLEEHGLAYEELKKIKPDIIVFSSSAAGHEGPLWDMRGYAPIFEAMSGLPYLTGWPDAPPANLGVSVDFRVARANALALMAALVGRLTTGQGERIDNACMEVVACLMPEVFMDYAMNGRVMERTGNLDPVYAPHNCYPCQGDQKWVSIVVGTEEEWRALCRTIGHPEWLKDARFADPYLRWKNQAVLDGAIAEWTKGHTHYEVMERLQTAGVAAVPSFNNAELFTDAHVRQRGVWRENQEVQWARSHIMPPWKLSETPVEVYRHCPDIGEDDEYVYGTLLKMSPEEIARLREEKVIY